MSQAYVWLECNLNNLLQTASESYHNFTNYLLDYTQDALEHLLIASLLYIVLCILLYIGLIKWKALGFKQDDKSLQRILLVIAHPDDECMFFGPTILNITKNNNNLVYLLCLSTGHNYGMGKTRKRELYASCSVLGIKEENVMVVQSNNLPDLLDYKWPIEVVARFVLDTVERYDITTLITFDRHGISNHPNHCSIYYAVAHLSVQKMLPSSCTVYVLETVNIIRKYWSILDIPVSYLLSRHRYILDCTSRLTVYKAMSKHKSQLVWFRYLYLLFSKYVFLNTLQKMNLSDIELDLEIDSEDD